MVYAVIMDIGPGYPPTQGSVRLINMGEIEQPKHWHSDGPCIRDFTYWSSLKEARDNFAQLRGQSWLAAIQFIDET
jgi:hypothetical protein